MTQADGVSLRRLRRDDERAYLAAVARSVRLHRPWAYPPDTAEAFAEYVAGSTTRIPLVVEARGELAGIYTFSQIVYGSFRNAYLGYYALEPFAGQGFMREGLELVLSYAFGDLRLHRVQASIQPENERSIGLVRGAGFRREGLARRYLKIGGRWRDHEHWAITAEERRDRHRRT